MKLAPIVIFSIVLTLVAISSFGVSEVHAVVLPQGSDTIYSPYNTSTLGFNTPYTLYYSVGNIGGNITSDTIELFVNGNPFYTNTVSANGIYPAPITFQSYGTQYITLESTTQNNTVTFVYSVNLLILGEPWWVWLIVAVAVGSCIAIVALIAKH